MPPPVILASGLEKSYGQVHAVRGIAFDVAPARCVGLLGPNGAGKTTTMRMIMGLTTPSAGELFVFGAPVATLSRADKSRSAWCPRRTISIPTSRSGRTSRSMDAISACRPR